MFPRYKTELYLSGNIAKRYIVFVIFFFYFFNNIGRKEIIGPMQIVFGPYKEAKFCLFQKYRTKSDSII